MPKKAPTSPAAKTSKRKVSPQVETKPEKLAVERSAEPLSKNWLYLKITAIILAFLLRFWRIDHPAEVVFDEVHFGKFASYYLQRQYFFDLHPPLAKLMYAFVGWLVGYDGRFKFDNIGDSYIVNQVPYIAYRSLAATLSSATVPLVFGVLQHCGFTAISCFVASMIVVLDCAQIAQSRLILLDATLIFFMMSAVYSYVRFSQERHRPFSLKWWAWLASTGISLSCVMSTKYVGLFTYLMIGVAVIADLWHLMDIRGKPEHERASLKYIFKHLVARFQALIFGPFLLYLFWFYVHFQILTFSGPGDDHMSPEFQATLEENPVVKEAFDIHYNDIVTIRSVNSDVFLHSHAEHYPLQYPDGRISSQGQQVTGYTIEDYNNLWQIVPPILLEDHEDKEFIPIVTSKPVMLRHVATDTYLLTHDVASPGFPSHEEFTTVSKDLAYGQDHEFALFYIDLASGGDVVRTKLSQFRLKHLKTPVSMWFTEKYLPEWGFNQFEINGNKNLEASGTLWYFDTIESIETFEERESRRTVAEGDKAPRRSFQEDYLELQRNMFVSNNQLTVSHPYMSSPWTWPILLRGISFWSNQETSSQIYLVGNFVGWYLENTAIVLFVLLYIFDNLAILREFNWIKPYARHKLHTTLLWLFLGWALHYFPFYLMGRQLFLHHYLPAHVLAAMLTGGMLDFLMGQVDYPAARYNPSRGLKTVATVLLIALCACFIFFAPLVYGLPLTPGGVRARQWLEIQLHFNK